MSEGGGESLSNAGNFWQGEGGFGEAPRLQFGLQNLWAVITVLHCKGDDESTC